MKLRLRSGWRNLAPCVVHRARTMLNAYVQMEETRLFMSGGVAQRMLVKLGIGSPPPFQDFSHGQFSDPHTSANAQS